MIRVEVVYHGRVQGVGFRATVRAAARQFRVAGWVRNEDDGTVKLDVQGDEPQVEALLAEIARRMGRFIERAHRLTLPVENAPEASGVEIRR